MSSSRIISKEVEFRRSTMSIRLREEALFAEWKDQRPGFVADGVADEDCYLATTPRLLFILKEVNAPGGGGWDLREFMRSGGRPQTWNNITRWTEGIRRLTSDIPWSKLASIDDQRRIEAIKTVAAINLKKSPGGHTTDLVQLNLVAVEDKLFLNRQFSIYEPDIVICCGSSVSDTFHRLVELPGEPAWQMTRKGIWFHEFKPGKHVISYAHPDARVADCLLYYGLVDAVREILKITLHN